MARTAAPKYVRATEPFSGDVDGDPFVVNPSEILTDDHPIVRKYGNLFKPVEATRQRPAVEQATAAPGEVRGTEENA